MSGITLASNQSIKPFKSGEEYLFAMKEDLAEWLGDLYQIEMDVNNVLHLLETGALLCAHANNVTRVADEFLRSGRTVETQLPSSEVTFVSSAHPETFLARDNVTNFITWCRKEMGIPDVLMFETDDLVLRKNEKNFVLCLLEVARRASRFGMASPILIQLEEEIEREICQETDDLPAQDRKPLRSFNTQNLDEMVQLLISQCTCPTRFLMVKVSEGKYRVGESNTLIFVRILRSHVMVRVGGGWDTLEHYLDKHDPCRCSSLVHKGPQSAPVHEIKERMNSTLPDDQEASHTTLMLSRYQPPLHSFVWPTSSRAQKRDPFPPRSSSSPNLQHQASHRRNSPSPQKLKKITNSGSQIHTCADSKESLIIHPSFRRGREAIRTPPAPRLTNGLPRPTHHPTSTKPEPEQTLQRNSNQSQPQQASERILGQTWTKSQFAFKLRQNSFVQEPVSQAGANLVMETQETQRRPFQSLSRHLHLYSKPPVIKIHEPEDNWDPKNNFLPSRMTRGTLSEAHISRSRTLAGISHEPTRNKQQDTSVSKRLEHLIPPYSPSPLSSAQEGVFYKTLENEILSNIQQLSLNSETSSKEKLIETPCRNLKDYSFGHYKASRGLIKLDLETTNRDNMFDAVIAELNGDQRRFEMVSLGKYRSTRGERGVAEEDQATTHPKISKPCVNSSWALLESSVDSKETYERVRVPVDTSNVERVLCSENEEAKNQSSLSFIQRRSLRKPERVPSIYKMIIKPCVRPRHENRSGRKPSKIPKPVFYRRWSYRDRLSHARTNHSQKVPLCTENSHENAGFKPKSQIPVMSGKI